MLAQIEATDPSEDDHPLLHLLHVALRTNADAAADRALIRLAAYYGATHQTHKRIAMLGQLAHRHPKDRAVRDELEAAHRDLGHARDAERLTTQPPRGRVEVVHLPREVPENLKDSLRDTDPPSSPAARPVPEDADTDLDLVPRHIVIPDEGTAQVDPKTLEVLRRLSR